MSMGAMARLRSINLNLIPILQALLRERGVSKAARSLGLTQSTVSTALAKLRTVLRDPLLVQVDGNWELTKRAVELTDQVENVCHALEHICNPDAYDPHVASGTITVALPDAAAVCIAPPLVRMLREHAPNLSLHFIDVWREFRVGQRSDEIQFMISLPSVLAHQRFGTLRSTLLWSDRMATIIGSRTDLNPVDLDEGYSVFFPGLEPITEAAEIVAAYTRDIKVTGRFQNCSVLALLAAEENVRAKVPYSFACKIRRYLPITILDSDAGDKPFEVHLAWSSVFDADPAHRWIRKMMIKTLRQIPAEVGCTLSPTISATL